MDKAPTIIYVILMLFYSLGLALLGRTIAQGKGDAFIAGYNTSSKKEQQQYDKYRLRCFVSRILYAVAVVLLLYVAVELLPDEWAMTVYIVLTLLLIVGLIIACLWGKEWVKKRR